MHAHHLDRRPSTPPLPATSVLGSRTLGYRQGLSLFTFELALEYAETCVIGGYLTHIILTAL